MAKKPTNTGGRPPFKPTAAQRRQVSIAAAGGMRVADMALALGISDVTLRKYFEVELSQGAACRRMEVLAALYAAAKRGSSAAAKAYLAVDPALGAPPLEPMPEPAAKAPTPGKKEAASIDAKTAHVGTDWDSLLSNSAPAPLQ